ncbi:SAM-dependent methyltransferase [Jeongeupia chitinilytica]|uniref:Cyclopropane-fatty-acyl-phospholipid synthase n=1 Tax=Jeongeupia chitinilytica TaxID=1041641 RepID=A0ABQ3GZ15_9NEIS|nr:cyclopropane-fatty-acyl-phospholipid synthase family protein [Jeongeupia chitinilytica]GHD59307.1 cyclopropane-fatty-acyl-phospholipid synthase [Jeongeupia chitinilytica]
MLIDKLGQFGIDQFDRWVGQVRAHGELPLQIRLWNGRDYRFSAAPTVTITLPSPHAVSYFRRPSLASLGEAYVEGQVDIDGPLPSVFEVAVALAGRLVSGNKLWGRLAARGRQHSRSLDSESVQYHYDVSNDFYRLWLDEQMVYSCAYFERGDEGLDAAQVKKLDHILTKVMLRPGERLLDIGCGWGALVLRAATKFGAHATGITLSENQYALAQQRIREAGVQDRCKVLLCDYRDVTGTYDKITSVGMFEHVGLANLGGYFAKVHSLLRDGGLVLNHGITTTDVDNGSGAFFGGGDFIDRYVFPNGELPHLALAVREMSAAGLEVIDIESLRRHYARTLEFWTERFEANADRIRTMVDDKHYRIWRVYLAGCAWAFANDWVSIYQLLGCRAGAIGLNPTPMSRSYMYPK